MKYWRGYLTAFIFAVITWALMQFGNSYTNLIDMIYPYVIRTLQNMLAQWSGGVDFLLWQVLAVFLVVVLLAVLVVFLVLKKNPVGWVGWVLAVCSFVYLLHTLLFGLSFGGGLCVGAAQQAGSSYAQSAGSGAAQKVSTGNAILFHVFVLLGFYFIINIHLLHL